MQGNGQTQLDRMGLDGHNKEAALKSTATAAMVASSNYTQLAQAQATAQWIKKS